MIALGQQQEQTTYSSGSEKAQKSMLEDQQMPKWKVALRVFWAKEAVHRKGQEVPRS
jgi:hypothetical protein